MSWYAVSMSTEWGEVPAGTWVVEASGDAEACRRAYEEVEGCYGEQRADSLHASPHGPFETREAAEDERLQLWRCENDWDPRDGDGEDYSWIWDW